MKLTLRLMDLDLKPSTPTPYNMGLSLKIFHYESDTETTTTNVLLATCCNDYHVLRAAFELYLYPFIHRAEVGLVGGCDSIICTNHLSSPVNNCAVDQAIDSQCARPAKHKICCITLLRTLITKPVHLKTS